MKIVSPLLVILLGMQCNLFSASPKAIKRQLTSAAKDLIKNGAKKSDDETGQKKDKKRRRTDPDIIKSPGKIPLEDCIICTTPLDPSTQARDSGSEIFSLHAQPTRAACKFHLRCINSWFHRYCYNQHSQRLINPRYIIQPFRCPLCQSIVNFNLDSISRLKELGYTSLLMKITTNTMLEEQIKITQSLDFMKVPPPQSVLWSNSERFPLQRTARIATECPADRDLPNYSTILHFIADLREERAEIFAQVLQSLQPKSFDPDTVKSFINFLSTPMPDNYNKTALHIAIVKNHTNIAQLLLRSVWNCYTTLESQLNGLSDYLQVERIRNTEH